MIVYTKTDFVEEVKRITNGKGVNVVYDSVGSTTFHKSLDCLLPRGMMVTFGQSSGPVGPNRSSGTESERFAVPDEAFAWAIHQRSLPNCIGDRFGHFKWIAAGRLRLHIHKVYKLADAADAHRDLRAAGQQAKLSRAMTEVARRI